MAELKGVARVADVMSHPAGPDTLNATLANEGIARKADTVGQKAIVPAGGVVQAAAFEKPGDASKGDANMAPAQGGPDLTGFEATKGTGVK